MMRFIPTPPLVLAGLLVGVGLSTPSFAHGPLAACRADVEVLCPDADSRRAVHDCLWEHRDDVSDECREAVETLRQRFAEVREACRDDVETLCPDADSRRAVHRCLREYRDEVSDECFDAIEALRGGRPCLDS